MQKMALAVIIFSEGFGISLLVPCSALGSAHGGLFLGKYLEGLGTGYRMSEYSILYGQFKNEMKKGKQFDL